MFSLGWDKCVDLIRRLVTPTRIANQLQPIVKLAEYLLLADCLEGVEFVGNCIASSVANVSDFDAKLLSVFITSKGWAKMKSPVKLMILNACAALVESSMDEMTRMLHCKKDRDDVLKSKMSKCLQLFLLIEKNRFDQEQKNVADNFLSLLDKLPTDYLSDLVLDLHKLEHSKGPQGLKSFPNCMDWYRKTCRILFSKDFLSTTTGKLAVKIVNCLVWVADEESWNLFAEKICASFPSGDSQLFVQVYLESSLIQQTLLASDAAFACFDRIVGHWIEHSKCLKDPSEFSWEQPNAKVGDYPEVELFLRSPEETKVFSNLFSDHEAARRFAKELEGNGPKMGCGVRVTISGDSSGARCKIVKIRNYHDAVVKDYEKRKSELEQFVSLRQRISKNRSGQHK